jgi:hypothetical protein
MDDRHLDGDALCDYAEGLLAPGARREADAHLDGCADCRRELEAVGGYFREMAALPTLKAPEKFLTRVHARIDRASPWKRMLAFLSSPRLLPVPLAVLVVAGVGAYLAIVSRDLSGTTQAGSAPAAQEGEERLATIPPAAAETRQAEPQPQPEPELLDQEPQAGKVKEEAKKKAGAESAEGQVALISRTIRRKSVAPASPAAGGGAKAAMAPPAPRPAPSEPPLIASVAEAALEDLDSFEPSLEAEVLSDRAQAKGDRSDAAKVLDESRPAPGSAGEAGAYASSPLAPARALRKAVPGSALRGKSARTETIAEDAREPMVAREAGGGGPWRDPGLILEWSPKADPETFFGGIEDLGIRILRSDESRIHRYELLVPAGTLDALEVYLRAQGKVTRVPKHLAAEGAGGPAVITLRILGDFSGR